MESRKLTMIDAEKIREDYERGATQNQLAAKYSVCKETIKNIVQMKSYLYDTIYGQTIFKKVTHYSENLF
jgi:hypothetical protein